MSKRNRTTPEERGRMLADSLRRAAQIAEQGGGGAVHVDPMLPPEPGGFADGVTAERHLREHICPTGQHPFGPYIEPARPRDRVSLEGEAVLVEFLPHHVALFRLLNPERSKALGHFAVNLAERTTVVKWYRRALKAGVALIVMFFAAARWGLDQLPVIQAIVGWFKGHSGS